MINVNVRVRLLLRVFAIMTLIGTPLVTPNYSYAQSSTWVPPTGTSGWCTVTPASSGANGCFSSPIEACELQHYYYGGDSDFNGADDTSRWDIKACKWPYHLGISYPANVTFNCATGYTKVVPGECLLEPVPFAQCECNPNVTTPYPIDITTGAKLFHAVDFEAADNSIVFDRSYISRPFARVGSTVITTHRSFANWAAFFDVHMDMAAYWTSGGNNGTVAVLTPDGVQLIFTRRNDGTMGAGSDSSQPVNNKNASLSLVGAWPSNPNTVINSVSQWLFVDPQSNIWTLETSLNSTTGKYDIARPVSEQRPDGTILYFTYDSNHTLTTITDQVGKSITLTWASATSTSANANVITEVNLPGGYSIHYIYQNANGATSSFQAQKLVKVEYLDGSGNVQDSTSYQYANTYYPTYVTSILDATGAVRWKVTYDGAGHAVQSEGPGGEFAENIVYSTSGNTLVRTRTNVLGRQTVYNFDHQSGNWGTTLTTENETASTNAVASSQSYTYDSARLLSSITDREGRVTKFTRNVGGLPTQVIEGYGTGTARTTNLTWNPIFNLPDQIQETGLTTSLTYDAQGRLSSRSLTDTTTQTVPYSTSGQIRTWTYTYGTAGGANGKLISVDGPLSGTGDTSYFGYNANGYLASVTDEVGKITSVTTWDWRGAPLAVVDPNSVSTTFTYDIHGRILTATVNPGATQSEYGFTYDVIGNLTKITLPKGGYLQYTYDSASRLTQVSNEKGEMLTLTPNGIGEATLSTIKNTSATVTQQQSQVYDELGRLIQVLGTASTTPTNLAYDKVDNLKTITDGRSKVSSNSFDALNRIITETNADSQSVKYSYNSQDVVVSHKDGRNLETTFVTNGFGDVIQEVSPDRGTRTYWYDSAGRLTKLVDGDNEETDFTYDNSGRLLTQVFPNAAWENMTYAYDSLASGNKGNGRLTSVAEQSGSTTFVYDAQGRVTQDTKSIQGISYPVQYDYDTNGDISQLTLPSGRVITYARDNSGLITAISTKPTTTGTVSNVATSITYQPFGALIGLTYGNGLILANTYNLNGWLTRIRVTGAAATTFDLGYQYYDDGSLGEIDDNAATGRTVYMSLSDSGRLTYAGGPWGQNSYSYDAAGNRIGSYLTVGGTTISDNEITSGSSNRLVKTTDALGVTKRTLSYRDGGDLYTDATAGGSTFQYLYSARKRLVVIKQDGLSVASYGYDFKGQRIWRTVAGIFSSPTIHYIFDEAGHLLSEQNGYTGNVLREYIWLDDKPLAVIDSTSGTAMTYYIHSGHLDEPQVMTDASKTKVWDAYVTPFGSAQVFTTASANVDIRLPGQWFQQEAAGAGLNQNQYRDYDPSLGRYIEADPIGLNGGQNPYAYVNGQAYDFTDRTGLIRPPVRPSIGGRGVTASQPEPLSLAETVFAARIDAANLAGRRISPSYRGYTYVGRPNESSAETAESMLENFAFRQALNNEGFCLAPNSPGYSLQNQYIRYLGQYGKGGVRFLPDGRIRFYGQFRPAKNPGPTAGAQMVREWNPGTGTVRDWNQGSYSNGDVRFVAPKPPTNSQNHILFSPDGNFQGRY